MLQGCRCLCHQVLIRRVCVPLSSVVASRPLSTDVYDVVISGGGMVGTATAAALGKEPLFRDKSILLLDSGPQTEYETPSTYSNRVSALSPASRRFLQAAGAWSVIESSGRFKPVDSMYVWEACSEAMIDFQKAGPEGHLAYMVENELTVHALSTSVKESADTVQLAYNTTVAKYEREAGPGGLTKVHLNNGDVISARLVIGADGFNSLARKSADINVASWGYDQVGVVATLKLDSLECGNSTAWQRFLPSGPIAVLPLNDDTSSLVWSTSPSHAKHLLGLSSESFVDELNHALSDVSQKDDLVLSVSERYWQLLQSCISSDSLTASQKQQPPTVLALDDKSRASFPYGMMHADKYVAPRLALVGDSCHRIHPLAGQGVNLGFGDVESLVRSLAHSLSLGSDIGGINQLIPYETERQAHVVAMAAGIDGLYRLYSNDWTPVVLARSLGLMTVNAMGSFKEFFRKHAQA